MRRYHVANTRAGRVGMIGSRTKPVTIYASRRRKRFTDAGLQRVVSPIGLAIGARPPTKIAVRIVAERIQRRSAMAP